MSDSSVELTINGQRHVYQGDPMARLLDVLRYELGLTGTKEGCGEGECGACTVLIDGEAVCACLVPVFQAQGHAIQTIEGVDKDSPLPRAFVTEAGVQCGACTPGMVLVAQALLERTPQPSRAEMREYLAGNLCRCTGYQAIFRAIDKAAGER